MIKPAAVKLYGWFVGGTMDGVVLTGMWPMPRPDFPMLGSGTMIGRLALVPAWIP